MARKKKTLNFAPDSEQEAELPVEEAQSVFTVAVENHTHAGVEYHSGDPITLESEATIKKLKDKGIIH